MSERVTARHRGSGVQLSKFWINCNELSLFVLEAQSSDIDLSVHTYVYIIEPTRMLCIQENCKHFKIKHSQYSTKKLFMLPQKYFLSVCREIVSQLVNSINMIKTCVLCRSLPNHVFIDIFLNLYEFGILLSLCA